MDTKYRIGFTCGAFDLTHAGHFLMFEECKKYCNYLIVGLQIDPSIDREDKHSPVQSTAERMIQLRACKFIDEIITYKTEDELLQLLYKNSKKFDVRFIGADWKEKFYTGIEMSIPIIFNSREHEFSSSSLRTRIYEAEKICHLKKQGETKI